MPVIGRTIRNTRTRMQFERCIMGWLVTILLVTYCSSVFGRGPFYASVLQAYLSFRKHSNSDLVSRRMMAETGNEDNASDELEVNWSFSSDAAVNSGNDVCGISNFNPLGRIVGGESAKLGNWPWATALGYQNTEGDTKYRCGGTLITVKHVLTAAHCIQLPPQELFQLKGILLGVTDLRKGTGQDFKLIDQVHVHPHYVAETHKNDIAIISLAETVNFNVKVRAACLPIGVATADGTPQTYVAGWGATHFGGSGPPILQWAEMPLLNSTLCQKAYQSRHQATDTTMICAGYVDGSKDACQGDSGGGLVGRDGDAYHVIGVVSYGFECARKDFPGVYVRVSNFTNWINATIHQAH